MLQPDEKIWAVLRLIRLLKHSEQAGLDWHTGLTMCLSKRIDRMIERRQAVMILDEFSQPQMFRPRPRCALLER